MILVDANILLYAYDSSSSRHAAARSWLEGVFNGDEAVGLALTTLLAFLRIGTNAAVFAEPLSVAEGIGLVESWLARPAVVVPAPTARHWSALHELAVAGQARGPLLMDAHLAALAVEHGAVLCTTDRDFARFPGVRVQDPLSGATT